MPRATGASTSTGGLRVDDVTARFGGVTAVDGASLAVAPGEIVALVGPSGCGKSTLLRAIAGLQPAEGRVAWDGADLSRERPDRRRFGLMFQDHALFAHRDVAANVGFGLTMDGVGGSERTRRIDEVLDLVGLAGYGDRAIDTLSGGEAQRVALARSLAPRPRLLMLDEPLGSLDRALRDRLAHDLRRILTDAGLAAIHVTHDQEEAYAVADRLVVMRAGTIERDGPVTDVWADPGTTFVARFLGHDNVVDGPELAALGLGPPGLAPPVTPVTSVALGAAVIREAAIELVPFGDAVEGPADAVAATVVDVRFRGPISRVELRVETDRGPLLLAVHRARPPAPGDRVGVRIDPVEVVALAEG